MMKPLSVFSLLMAVLLSSILILIFYVIRKKRFFIRHFGVFSMTMLYLLCVFRMVLPLELPFTTEINIEPVLNPLISTLYHQEVLIGNQTVKLIEGFIVLWIVVTFVLLTRFALRYQVMCRGIGKLKKQENAQLQQMMDQIQRKQGHSIPVRVLYCSAITSPCSMGLWKKQILLPSEEYSADELYYILLHEYTHFQNHDLAVKMLAYIFRCVFWWNPAVYLLTKDLSQVLEIKCDLTVVSGLNNTEKANYLTVILTQLTKGDSKDTLIPLSQATAFFRGMRGKSAAEERFQHVLAHSGKGRRFSFVRLAIFGMVFSLLALSYLFVFQSAFEAPIEDIVIAEGAYEIENEEIIIRENDDGSFTMIIENNEFDIDEDAAKDFIRQGSKFI